MINVNKKIISNRMKKLTKEQCIFYGQFFLMILICIVHALSSGHNANFTAINGTFQNYNPVRRLLAGQIPYKDFQDYLGLGHLYSGAIATVLFGGDYQASLMAFSFLSILGFALLGVVLGIAIFRKRTTAVGATNILLVLLLTQPFFWVNALQGTDEMREAMNIAIKTGNSARFVRGFAVPFACFLLWISYELWEKLKDKHTGIRKTQFVVIAMGGVSAFCFIWSNDYGISSWVCLQLMFLIILFAKLKKCFKPLLILFSEVLVSGIWLFLLVEIFTLGHFKGWLDSVFGTGGYQGWYYNIIEFDRSYFLYDVDFSFIMMLQAFLCLAYLIQLCKSTVDKQSVIRFGIPAFINMTCFCAVNEYRLLSGAFSYEVALTALFLSIVFEFCHHAVPFVNAVKMQKVTLIVSLLVSFAWIISDLKDEFVFWAAEEKEGTYVEAMGGYVANGEDLLQTSEFLDGKDFFATYASAQEVVENKFQPSGIDYIIHVLGDKTREQYLEAFQNGDFEYAATITPQYSGWEQWIMRANWFWYRKLYENWHPVYANSYEMYWERNEKGESYLSNSECNVDVQQIDEQTVRIAIRADENVNGIADLYLDYEVKKSDRLLAKLIIQPMLTVENAANIYSDVMYESNNLRQSGKEYIPVSMINGYGEVVLTSQPDIATYLQVQECSVGNVYMAPYAFVKVEEVATDEHETMVVVENNLYTADETSGVVGIAVDGISYRVLERRVDDSKLYLVIEDIAADKITQEIFNHGNMIQILR